MKINVTKKNIKSGKRSNAFYCPIALAMQETLEIKDIGVSASFITIEGEWLRDIQKQLKILLEHLIKIKKLNHLVSQLS